MFIQYVGKSSCNPSLSYDIAMRASHRQPETRRGAIEFGGHDVREITGYSIRGFSVIEFESPGLRALIVRVTLDYMAPRANSAHFGRAICELLRANGKFLVRCRESSSASTRKYRLLLRKRQTELAQFSSAAIISFQFIHSLLGKLYIPSLNSINIANGERDKKQQFSLFES